MIQTKSTELIVDASPIAIAAILTQKSEQCSTPRVVSYATSALMPTEQCYPQKHQACAVTWSILHFLMYLCGGKEFTVITDHQPLVPIYNKPNTTLPPRLERLVLKVQQFPAKLVYKPGKDNISDYLSRHIPDNDKISADLLEEVEEHVNWTLKNATPKAITLEKIAKATAMDSALQKVILNT